jgi:beta-glucanase (GH16 family)
MKIFTRIRSLTGIALAGLILPGFLALNASAITTRTPVVIDDFNDGDASDWGFFGGNAAGGGGEALADRPQEGTHYLSTGWGGDGSNSVFYGGLFRNFDNGAQVTPPPDPWLNVWVLNQSDATVDQYTLEITIREDLDGNGWTDGAEDSFRLETTFASADFDDEWVLISAPLSSFNNLATGGDGVFNGNLDEVVVVVSGVQGGSGSTVEVDFDQFSFTSSGPVFSSLTVFDDMEHGNPLGNGWFTFGGSVGGGGIGPNATDLPPEDGGVYSLETGWGSGGTPGFYGGFGRTSPRDLTLTDHFNFWINPDADQDYTLEINLQEDDNGDDAAVPADDDEFQYNCVVSPTGPCAISGGGWQRVSIPLADFFDDNSSFTGGNGVLDAVPVSAGGNGQLVNVVIAVIGNSGSDASFRTDYWAFSDGPLAEPVQIVDDFENGLPSGTDLNGVSIGFYTFNDAASSIAIATTQTPPAPVPGSDASNTVLAMTADVAAFAGFIHGFENAAVDTWVTQDWSAYEGLRLWIYGQNSGTDMFLDVLDNRNPGSSTDDAERWTVNFSDDFSGWQLFEFPFTDFVRKGVGNGAPDDGFGLTEVHGWALGTLGTGGAITYYVDDAVLYGVAEIPELMVTFAAGSYDVEEGTTGDITVKLNRPMNSDDPAQVSIDYFTGTSVSAIAGRDYTPVSGTLTFVNGGPSELSFPLETFDNGKWQGDKVVPLKLANPVDVAIDPNPASSFATILENDAFDPYLTDDFERDPYLWEAGSQTMLSALEIMSGDPWALPGQGAYEGVLQVDSPLAVEAEVQGTACKGGDGVIPVQLLTTDTFDALTVDHTTVTLGDASEAHVDKRTGLPRRHEEDVDGDGDIDLVFHFRAAETGLDCLGDNYAIEGETFDGQPISSGTAGASFSRDFAIGHDWSAGEKLAFWYYGSGSGTPVTVRLKDNRAPDPGPGGWQMVWSDEFDAPAGAPPDPENWSHDIGDGTGNGIPGWGNSELQYYTDDTANASTDGAGNLVLTVREADGSLYCYYGPCEYTSARLISKYKAEFAYGRIESRILVPRGTGIWPAFWSLGTDIDLVSWPQTGEIDFMEFVGRQPEEIFGTIHGPGYSGGASFGNVYQFGEPVYNDYHTFAVEWEPDQIRWYVDGMLYHTATPADVAPNEWVFNDPVFLLLNVAMGGNFGGPVGDDFSPPQSMAVDYVRVYQGPDSAERFEATFVDNVAGWQQVEIPFADFTRSAEQPAGAPDDGLTLTDVWGYGFEVPQGGMVMLDQLRVELLPPPTEITVTNLNDGGPGSLRQALVDIAADGMIYLDPTLAGGTMYLTSGPLVLSRNVMIDGSSAPGITLDGQGADRLLIVDAGVIATVGGLTFTNGYGFQLAGGILNNGTLTLVEVSVTGNIMTTDAGDFWQGGGGIYNGDGSTLHLVDSTVAGNNSGWSGGGVYSFFNSTTIIERSTVSGNVAGDVGGGLRLLGNAEIVNSTISGNESMGWYGGALFLTDGVVNMTNATVAGNTSPSSAPAAVFVGTFGPGSATLNLGNSIVAGNVTEGCFLAPFGAGAVAINSQGNNVFSDGTCFPVASDQVVADAGLDSLGDNGGPTLTHALLPGSPAVDAANAATCPATDQRGVARPQGAGCDVGALESAPP